jgi:hypothetical protein
LPLKIKVSYMMVLGAKRKTGVSCTLAAFASVMAI